MYNHFLYFGYWAVNSLVLYFASLTISSDILRLGSWRFNPLEASLYAGFLLTFLIWVCWDFAIARKFNFQKELVSFIFFLLVNAVSIWAVSRFDFTGFEINNYTWIVVIAAVATLVQSLTRRVIVRGSL